MLRRHRKTKIIVTLGKSSSDVSMLKALILGGMDMVRIGDRFVSDKQAVLDNLKIAIRETGITVGVMLGLRESDMRVSSLSPTEVLQLEEGQIIHLTTNQGHKPTASTIYCNNAEFPSLVVPGDKLLIDFGKVILTVVDLECELSEDLLEDHSKPKKHSLTHENEGDHPIIHESHSEVTIPRLKRIPKPEKHTVTVVCRVDHNCILVHSKPLHISTHDGRPQPISNSNDVEDIKNIRWAVENDIDVVVFKQIRETSDLVDYSCSDYRRFIGIQNKDSLEVGRELVSITDGCVIGRGMLALETSLPEVCKVQKEVSAYCNELAKPLIISTQLLESMCTNSVPSRSEVNDITNAVLDGCDALLLSAETAFGHHPLVALEACSRICLETEESQEYARIAMLAMQKRPRCLTITENICYCAVQSVLKVKATVIICISERGVSALTLAKYKPACPILAITNNLRTLKYLRIVRGVIPTIMTDLTGEFFPRALQQAIDFQLAVPGDSVVYIGGGSDSFATGDTCTLRISKVIG